MPHSTIHLTAGTETPSSTYVVCMMASSKAYTTFSEPNSTTVKTPTTFGMLSSDRQAVVELFATSAVPVAYVSRSMTPTEMRYAQIEEALAFTWACEWLSDYLIGKSFHIHRDHKPLVPLFSTKHLEELLVRVQRFCLQMMRYFTISHVPGMMRQTSLI